MTTASSDTEAALIVATVYQDSLTRHWAARLWGQVGRLIGGGDICHTSWRISDLAHAEAFSDAVQVAARADVLVVSLRDAGVLPLNLYMWIDGWLPRRAGRAGALVALIGVPAHPDAQCGQTRQFLEAVARNAGLDFLPREHKLPEERFTLSEPANTTPAIEGVLAVPGGTFGRAPETRLHWELHE